MKIDKQQFKSYAKFETKELSSDSSGQGIIKVSGWASKSFENGKPVIDRDGENINTKNFDLTHAKVLLYDHDWAKPIGKMVLSHKPEGIWIDSEIHEAMDNKTYYAVKEGILDSFSIGFYATEAEYINVDGEDYLSFTEGGVYECSVVSIPSNTSAMIQTTSVIKSVVKDGECTGLQCSVKSLKEMNPDCGCPLEILKGNEEKNMKTTKPNIQEIVKALTFEETMQDSWNEKQRLNHYMEILYETISDNWYESLWSEGLTPEEAKQNILNALDSFKEKLDEFTTLEFEPAQVEKTLEGKDMKTKEVEIKDTPETEEEGQEPVETSEVEDAEKEEGEENTTPDSDEETPEQGSVEEPEAQKEEEVAEEVEPTEPVPAEESISKPTVQTLIGELQTVTFDDMSAEEIEALYNVSADTLEKIEALVKAEVESGEE